MLTKTDSRDLHSSLCFIQFLAWLLFLTSAFLGFSCRSTGRGATPESQPHEVGTSGPVLSPTHLVTQISRVSLPKDDAPHLNSRTEWWYYNGNFTDAEGNRYSFHYVVFQVSIPNLAPVNVFHIAISDYKTGTYLTDQRLIPAVARKDVSGFDFNATDWAISGYDGNDELKTSIGSYGLALSLHALKSPVLHGSGGIINFGQASQSYYYSRTRMNITGKITMSGRESAVRGEAWFDHQWGDFAPQSLSWDWFSLRLTDGSDLMLYQIRDTKGKFIAKLGTLVKADGTSVALLSNDFKVEALGTWKSLNTGIVYPIEWTLETPSSSVLVHLRPLLDNAEFDATRTTRNSYWEGAVTVTGSHQGDGFLELAGYFL